MGSRKAMLPGANAMPRERKGRPRELPDQEHEVCDTATLTTQHMQRFQVPRPSVNENEPGRADSLVVFGHAQIPCRVGSCSCVYGVRVPKCMGNVRLMLVYLMIGLSLVTEFHRHLNIYSVLPASSVLSAKHVFPMLGSSRKVFVLVHRLLHDSGCQFTRQK